MRAGGGAPGGGGGHDTGATPARCDIGGAPRCVPSCQARGRDRGELELGGREPGAQGARKERRSEVARKPGSAWKPPRSPEGPAMVVLELAVLAVGCHFLPLDAGGGERANRALGVCCMFPECRVGRLTLHPIRTPCLRLAGKPADDADAAVFDPTSVPKCIADASGPGGGGRLGQPRPAVPPWAPLPGLAVPRRAPQAAHIHICTRTRVRYAHVSRVYVSMCVFSVAPSDVYTAGDAAEYGGHAPKRPREVHAGGGRRAAPRRPRPRARGREGARGAASRAKGAAGFPRFSIWGSGSGLWGPRTCPPHSAEWESYLFTRA